MKLSLLALTTLAGTAFAGHDEEAKAISQAKVPIVKAITTAEKHVGGNAFDADFNHSISNGWVYDIEVAKGTQVFDVKVNADTGKVISSVEDHND